MAKQKEGSLQERIQTLIEKRGGWVIKEWGNMTKRPGIPDLLFCYKGLFCAIEAKIENNETSRQQEIQLRKIRKSQGLTMVCWSTDDAEDFLTYIDEKLNIEVIEGSNVWQEIEKARFRIIGKIKESGYELGGENGNI